MKLKVSCDVCGKEMDASTAFTMNDRDFCPDHSLGYQLKDLRERRNQLKAWLEETHLQKLREMDEQIARLERKNAS